jgi:hypothetical protein
MNKIGRMHKSVESHNKEPSGLIMHIPDSLVQPPPVDIPHIMRAILL